MAIPYTNRSAIAIIPELALRNKPAPTMDEIQLEFIRVYPTIRLGSVFDCMQFIGKGKLRLTFTTASKMENFIHDGLTFRGHPLELKPISTRRWVRVRHYPYGAPVAHLEKKLLQYGKWFNVRHESLRNVAIGDISVLMEVEKNIPSKLYINGHRCHIHYTGQQQTCFKCNKTGHHSRQCPDNQAIAPQQAGPQLAATQQSGIPTAAQIVAGTQKPPSPRTIVGLNATTHPKTPVQPARLSVDAVTKIALPASPPAGQSSAQDTDISRDVGPPQPLPPPPPPPPPAPAPPIPPNPPKKTTDVTHDQVSPPAHESKRRFLSFTPPPKLSPMPPSPTPTSTNPPLPSTPMATTPPPIGFSPSQDGDVFGQEKQEDSKFSPAISTDSSAASLISAPLKTQPVASKDTIVSPDLFSSHSQSLDRDKKQHRDSAKHNFPGHPAPQRTSTFRRLKSDHKPNLKNARFRWKQNNNPNINRFEVLAKIDDDDQLVLHESFSEPDVGLTSSGNLTFKDDPPQVRRIPNAPCRDTDTPASDV